MKKLIYLFSLLIILLSSSCSHSFHNVRQYSLRHYVRIGPGVHPVKESIVEKTTNQIELSNTKQEIKTPVTNTKGNPILATKPKKQGKNINGKENFIKSSFEKIWKLFPQKTHKLSKSIKKDDVKKNKSTSETGVFNILSFVLGLTAAILAIITAFMFLFTLAFPYTAAACFIMLGIVCGIAFLAIVFGVVGLSRPLPKRGFGIAGIITGGIAIVLVLCAMLLFLGFL